MSRRSHWRYLPLIVALLTLSAVLIVGLSDPIVSAQANPTPTNDATGTFVASAVNVVATTDAGLSTASAARTPTDPVTDAATVAPVDGSLPSDDPVITEPTIDNGDPDSTLPGSIDVATVMQFWWAYAPLIATWLTGLVLGLFNTPTTNQQQTVTNICGFLVAFAGVFLSGGLNNFQPSVMGIAYAVMMTHQYYKNSVAVRKTSNGLENMVLQLRGKSPRPPTPPKQADPGPTLGVRSQQVSGKLTPV